MNAVLERTKRGTRRCVRESMKEPGARQIHNTIRVQVIMDFPHQRKLESINMHVQQE